MSLCTGNKGARSLAQYARNIYDFVTCIEESPCIIKRVIALDVLFLFLLNKVSSLQIIKIIIKKNFKKKLIYMGPIIFVIL